MSGISLHRLRDGLQEVLLHTGTSSRPGKLASGLLIRDTTYLLAAFPKLRRGVKLAREKEEVSPILLRAGRGRGQVRIESRSVEHFGCFHTVLNKRSRGTAYRCHRDSSRKMSFIVPRPASPPEFPR